MTALTSPATTAGAKNRAQRPATIRWAVILSLVHGVSGIAVISTMPNVDDRPQFLMVNCIIAALLFTGAWFIWKGSRKGTMAAIAFNAIFFLMAVPELFADKPAGLPFFAAAIIVLAATTIGLALAPASRAYRVGR